MGQVLALMNEKGGVGKSSLTFSCAWCLMEQGRRVLVIDMDGQRANFTYLAGVCADESSLTMVDVLTRNVDIARSIQSVASASFGCLDLIPATTSLVSLPVTAKISRMKRVVRDVSECYDYVFLDVNPSPDWRHALTLSVLDAVGIVMLPDVVSLEANRGIYDSVLEVKEGINTRLRIMGFVLNQFDARPRVARAVLERAQAMAGQCGTSLFGFVRKSVVMTEASSVHKGVTAYDPGAAVSQDIRQLAYELETRLRKGNNA